MTDNGTIVRAQWFVFIDGGR